MPADVATYATFNETVTFPEMLEILWKHRYTGQITINFLNGSAQVIEMPVQDAVQIRLKHAPRPPRT